MPTFDGFDVSHYQGSNFPWQWAVDTYATSFGACKMTDGTSMVDNTGAHNRDAMKAVGIRWRGLYHYCRAGDPTGNAHHFQDTVGDLEDGEFAMLDLESGMTDDAGAVMTILEAFEAIYPGRVGDYRGKYFGGANSHMFDPWPWLMAAYPWPNQTLPATDRQPCVWQFAGGEHGVVAPGLRDNGWPIGAVDSNQVLIAAELDRICNLTALPPPVHPIGVEMKSGHYRDDRPDGQWQVWWVNRDWKDSLYSYPVNDMPRGGDYDLLDGLPDGLLTAKFSVLVAIMNRQNRPTPLPVAAPPSNTVPVHDHPVPASRTGASS